MKEILARPAPCARVARPRSPRLSRLAVAVALAPLLAGFALSMLGCAGAQHDDDEFVAARKHRPSRKLPASRERERERTGDVEREGDDDDGAGGTDGIVHWEHKLSEDAPGLLAEFRRRASRYGCTTQGDDDSVLARCAEAPIKLVKRGRNVSVACQGVSLDACRELFGRIVDVEKDRSGQNPRMW